MTLDPTDRGAYERGLMPERAANLENQDAMALAPAESAWKR